MKFYACVGVALLMAVFLTGCAESRAYHSYSEEVESWSYPKKVGITFKDWFLDLTDIAGADIGAGETLGINVQPTELIQVGAMAGDTFNFGWRERSMGFWREVRTEGGFSWFYWRQLQMEPALGTPSLIRQPRLTRGFPIRYNHPHHWMDLGARVGLIFVQAGVHASPKQALDFVVSTLTLPVDLVVRPAFDLVDVHIPEFDYCEDDTASQVRKKYEVELINHPEIFEPVEKFHELFLEYPGG